MVSGTDLDSVFAAVLEENNTQVVFKHLADLDNQRRVLSSRWVWELIQNARGTVGSQSQLEIEIALRDEHLFFRHNGAPFRDREIAHLILHGSTKRDPLDIGRFGTGFITTHLISRCVRVRGRLIDGRSFDFNLNREGANERDLQTAMKASQEEFKTSLDRVVANVPDPYTTEYSYPLSPVVRDVVVEGVNSLKRSVPYVFAFNSMLRRFSILTEEGAPQITTGEPLDPLCAGTTWMRIRTKGHNADQWVVTAGDDDVVAAMVIDLGSATPTVRPPESIPKLFVAFPLNGTDDLCIPLVLNSERFTPREERDGVFLGVGTNDANKQNKELFSRGCHSIVTLISLAAEQAWTDAPKLATLQRLENKPWADRNWLQSAIQSILIQGLRARSLLRTISGVLVRPESAWIPVGCASTSSLDLWEVSQHLAIAADHLPQRDDQEAWASAANSWTAFLGLATRSQANSGQSTALQTA